MAYQLSVSISGPGTSERAHWGLVIHKPPNRVGDLLHVRVIDEDTNLFAFENRSGHVIDDQNAWGLAKIAMLDDVQRAKALSILFNEKPPSNGGKDCQDWVLDALVSLEVEELVPDGTTQTWTSRTGKQTKAIQHEVGLNWEVLNGRW
ncbi:hypothetical protein P875_00042553 [Aspergillus parasiticus SU-1]|uniref:Uncharacterized protein n=1 Tax=Aspergillus parasiticus (strain ATCC 56775 / NRRL 5862 / SRRC 143 / SU-1) TaxID=1403190 RepID=A0A0F0I0D2_ASPPU|nr:hypothetical protein P875_00042553 [Aspergillus parasiticus SU-1]